MRSRIAAVLLSIVSLLIVHPAGSKAANDDFEDDEIVVGLALGVSIDAVNARYGTHTIEHSQGTQDYLIGTQPGADLDALISLLSQDPDLVYSEKNQTSDIAEGIQG